MSFRPYADNVVLELESLQKETESGLAIVETKPKHRIAKVIASGPGYYMSFQGRDPNGRYSSRRVYSLVPNEVKAGDRVIVDALCGQNYAMDLTIPRHNKSAEFQELFGDKGEFRIVREEEILAVVES